MSTGSDLMGLGMPPMLANIISEAGSGPTTLTAAGTSYATSTKIKTSDSAVICSTGVAGANAGIGLPAVGTASGVLLGDEILIVNSGTDSLPVYASTGVIIYCNGSSTSLMQVSVGKSAIVWPMSSSVWGGVQ